MRDVDAAAGLVLVIEAWAAAYYRDESCGPARLPQSRSYRFCGADEAALCGAAPSFTAADFRRNRRRCRGPSHDGSAWTCRRANSPFPGAGKLSGATQPGWGRRLFPSSLRGSSRSRGIMWVWEDSCGAATASAEACDENPNCSAARRRGCQKCVKQRHLCRIEWLGISILHIDPPESEEHR